MNCLNLFHGCNFYQVSIGVDGEECFFESLAQRDKMAIAFDVVDGGFLDIRFRLLGPDQSAIHDDHLTEKRASTTGRYTFSAHIPGVYKFCFNNQQASRTLKNVKFLVELQNASSTASPIAGEHGQLGPQVQEIMMRLHYVKYEAEYAALNLVTHHYIQENINSFVTGWAMFEFLLTVIVMATQIIYLRKLFERRLRV